MKSDTLSFPAERHVAASRSTAAPKGSYPAPAQSTKAVFDLLMPFAESTDAKLRGNAAHAYAALIEAPEADVRDRAREQLIAMVGTDAAPGAGPEWERRFASRAIDAFRHLPPEEFDRCCDELLRLAAESSSTAQRDACARFFLAANVEGGRRMPAGWLKVQRLMWRAGRPGFWRSVWAGAWRAMVVWIIISGCMGAVMPNHDTTRTVVLLYLSMGACAVIAVLSVGGRFIQSWGVQSIDAVLCGTVFALTVALDGWIDPLQQQGAALAVNIALGFVLGTALRWRRWLSNSLQIDVSRPLRAAEPLVVFCFATLAFMVASVCGGDTRALAAGWSLVAPTALTTGWLDNWLARTGVQPLLARLRKITRPFVVVVPALAVVAASLLWGYVNWSLNLGRDPRLLTQPDLVKLPDILSGSKDYKEPMRLGVRVPYQVTRPGRYRFSASPAAPTQPIELHIVAPEGIEDPPAVASTALAPATVEQEFTVGRYTACLSVVGATACDASTAGSKTLTDFGASVIGGSGPDLTLKAPLPTLAISAVKASGSVR